MLAFWGSALNDLLCDFNLSRSFGLSGLFFLSAFPFFFLHPLTSKDLTFFGILVTINIIVF
jgi:hypothetical protein